MKLELRSCSKTVPLSDINDIEGCQAVWCVLTPADIHTPPVFVGRTDEVVFKLSRLEAGEALLCGRLEEEEPLHIAADVL